MCVQFVCAINTWQSLSCLVTNRVAEWDEAAYSERNNVLETIIDHYTVGNWTLFSGTIHSYRKWRNIQKSTHFNTHTSSHYTCFLCSHTVPETSLFYNRHVEQWDVSLPNMANLISQFWIQGLYIYIHTVFWHNFNLMWQLSIYAILFSTFAKTSKPPSSFLILIFTPSLLSYTHTPSHTHTHWCTQTHAEPRLW